MSSSLESPHQEGVPDWDALYRARGTEVSTTRPIFTGDVFAGIALPGSTGKVKNRNVIVIQHPCSMRINGVDLAWQVLVAEVTNRKELSEEDWTTGNFNLMPLPALRPDTESQARHQAGNFDNLYMVSPDQLASRIASLSPLGVNLLLQRWVHFSSRVIVPSFDFHKQSVSYYEEADLVEEWCDEMDSGDQRADTEECVNWLRKDNGGRSYQEMLKDVQAHSVVRKAMRAELKARR
ncbi:hypothetical protein [Microbacterium lacticum]